VGVVTLLAAGVTPCYVVFVRTPDAGFAGRRVLSGRVERTGPTLGLGGGAFGSQTGVSLIAALGRSSDHPIWQQWDEMALGSEGGLRHMLRRGFRGCG
jgi:hypothetical protein